MKEKFVFHDFEKGIFRGMFLYTVFIAINTVIDQINWNVDKLLLGRFKGTADVAIYSVGYNLYVCYMLFSISISGVFTPRIHKIVNETKDNLRQQKEKLTNLFVKVGRIQFLILSLIASGIIFFGKYFIVKILAGEGYESSYFVALLLIIPSTVEFIQSLGVEMQRAENKHQFRSIAYLAMAFINLGLSIVLCQIYGAVGSAFGTAVSFVAANGITMNIYYHKKCNLNVFVFWKNIILQARGLIIPIIAGCCILYFFEINSIFEFIGLVIVYTIVYIISVWCFSMNDYEKQLVIVPLKKIMRVTDSKNR